MVVRLGIGALGFTLLGYVIPVERVLQEITRQREGALPVRLGVTLERPGADSPRRAWIDLLPGGGWRIIDEEGRRWLGQGPRVREGETADPPLGLGGAWLLVISEEEPLLSHLESLGVDLRRNELARCGEGDCFVLGGRDAPAQLWVDKDRFEIRRLRTRRGRTLEFLGYRERGGRGGSRIPTRIRVLDPLGPIAEVGILEVIDAPELDEVPDLSRLAE